MSITERIRDYAYAHHLSACFQNHRREDCPSTVLALALADVLALCDDWDKAGACNGTPAIRAAITSRLEGDSDK